MTTIDGGFVWRVLAAAGFAVFLAVTFFKAKDAMAAKMGRTVKPAATGRAA